VSGMAIYLIGCPPPAASKTLVDLIAMRYKPCHVSPMRWPQPTAVTFTLLNINLYIKSTPTPTPTGLIPIPYHTLPLPRSLVTTQRLDTPSLSQITSPGRTSSRSSIHPACPAYIYPRSDQSLSALFGSYSPAFFKQVIYLSSSQELLHPRHSTTLD